MQYHTSSHAVYHHTLITCILYSPGIEDKTWLILPPFSTMLFFSSFAVSLKDFSANYPHFSWYRFLSFCNMEAWCYRPPHKLQQWYFHHGVWESVRAKVALKSRKACVHLCVCYTTSHLIFVFFPSACVAFRGFCLCSSEHVHPTHTFTAVPAVIHVCVECHKHTGTCCSFGLELHRSTAPH